MKIKARDFARPERVCYLSVTVMTERIAVLAAAALVLGLCMSAVSAEDRSFPAEVTGTIRSFDQQTQTFTIKVDEPARILTLAVGRDCKFETSGAPGGERILKPGARVKVSYFATIFTGNIAVAVAMTTTRYAHELRRSQAGAMSQNTGVSTTSRHRRFSFTSTTGLKAEFSVAASQARFGTRNELGSHEVSDRAQKPLPGNV